MLDTRELRRRFAQLGSEGPRRLPPLRTPHHLRLADRAHLEQKGTRKPALLRRGKGSSAASTLRRVQLSSVESKRLKSATCGGGRTTSGTAVAPSVRGNAASSQMG